MAEGKLIPYNGGGWERVVRVLLGSLGPIRKGILSRFMDSPLFTDALCAERACLGYFSIAMIKHPDQGILKKGEFIWGYSSRGISV